MITPADAIARAGRDQHRAIARLIDEQVFQHIMQRQPMIDEIKKIDADLTGFVKTLELKFFKGKLHQKVIAGNPGQTPDHAWLPIESHDVAAPAPGEAIAADPTPETAKEDPKT
jgi:hypothetical protein